MGMETVRIKIPSRMLSPRCPLGMPRASPRRSERLWVSLWQCRSLNLNLKSRGRSWIARWLKISEVPGMHTPTHRPQGWTLHSCRLLNRVTTLLRMLRISWGGSPAQKARLRARIITVWITPQSIVITIPVWTCLRTPWLQGVVTSIAWWLSSKTTALTNPLLSRSRPSPQHKVPWQRQAPTSLVVVPVALGPVLRT